MAPHLAGDADRALSDVRNEVVAHLCPHLQAGADRLFPAWRRTRATRSPRWALSAAAIATRLTGFAGKGEVMVMSFKKTDTGVAMVFQEWRGPAFDPATPASWPVATAVVEARAKQLQDAGGADRLAD